MTDHRETNPAPHPVISLQKAHVRFPRALWSGLAPAVSLADHRLLDEASDATDHRGRAQGGPVPELHHSQKLPAGHNENDVGQHVCRHPRDDRPLSKP